MKSYNKIELEEAKTAIESTISKCEKSLIKFSDNSPQRTLLIKRIKALVISKELIESAILKLSDIQKDGSNS